MKAARASAAWTRADPEALGERLAKIDLAPLFGLPLPDSGARFHPARELLVVKKALFRQCLQFQKSALLWRIFLALSGSHKQLLYRAFILNEALSPEQWARLIGMQDFAEWRSRSWLETHGTRYSWNSRVVHTGHGVLVLDDVKDKEHVYCGADSLVFVEFCLARLGSVARVRYLDVGIGAGAVLCSLAPRFRAALGVDINPRAVALARLNARSNNLSNVRIEEADVFEMVGAQRYDVITWNVPYMFVPEDRRRTCNDGGELGIGLTVRFLETVTELLGPGGVAFLMTSSPVLSSGRRPLHESLERIGPTQGLDFQVFGQWFLAGGEHEEFLRANSVRAIEVVIVRATSGSGNIEYSARSVGSRLGF
jgi:methylase of polypeptide subunit release factors